MDDITALDILGERLAAVVESVQNLKEEVCAMGDIDPSDPDYKRSNYVPIDHTVEVPLALNP